MPRVTSRRSESRFRKPDFRRYALHLSDSGQGLAKRNSRWIAADGTVREGRNLQ
jgi:hypothetical protein